MDDKLPGASYVCKEEDTFSGAHPCLGKGMSHEARHFPCCSCSEPSVRDTTVFKSIFARAATFLILKLVKERSRCRTQAEIGKCGEAFKDLDSMVGLQEVIFGREQGWHMQAFDITDERRYFGQAPFCAAVNITGK